MAKRITWLNHSTICEQLTDLVKSDDGYPTVSDSQAQAQPQEQITKGNTVPPNKNLNNSEGVPGMRNCFPTEFTRIWSGKPFCFRTRHEVAPAFISEVFNHTRQAARFAWHRTH
ncbi:hypothetical protein LSAT2_010792 [Lamellibrachia satsuma]|nr:hypothetical protein LSAT2_010792 [Lamellibrachia satsuma]